MVNYYFKEKLWFYIMILSISFCYFNEFLFLYLFTRLSPVIHYIYYFLMVFILYYFLNVHKNWLKKTPESNLVKCAGQNNTLKIQTLA